MRDQRMRREREVEDRKRQHESGGHPAHALSAERKGEQEPPADVQHGDDLDAVTGAMAIEEAAGGQREHRHAGCDPDGRGGDAGGELRRGPRGDPQPRGVEERAQRLAQTPHDAPGEPEERVPLEVPAEADVVPGGRSYQPPGLRPGVEPDRSIVHVVERVAVVIDDVPPQEEEGHRDESGQRRVRARRRKDPQAVESDGGGHEPKEREVRVPLRQVSDAHERAGAQPGPSPALEGEGNRAHGHEQRAGVEDIGQDAAGDLIERRHEREQQHRGEAGGRTEGAPGQKAGRRQQQQGRGKRDELCVREELRAIMRERLQNQGEGREPIVFAAEAVEMTVDHFGRPAHPVVVARQRQVGDLVVARLAAERAQAQRLGGEGGHRERDERDHDAPARCGPRRRGKPRVDSGEETQGATDRTTWPGLGNPVVHCSLTRRA